MHKKTKRIFEIPTFFVFLSFLFGLSNFFDTFLKLMLQYMTLPIQYPLQIDLKPLFFILQAICFVLFIYYARKINQAPNSNFGSLSKLMILVLTMTIALFAISMFINIGLYSPLIYITTFMWLLSYTVGLTLVCLWFSSRLLGESRYRAFAPIFLLMGVAFTLNVISQVIFWPQTFFNVALPPEVDTGTRLLTTLLIAVALFYTCILLVARKKSGSISTTVLSNKQFYVSIFTLILPFFLNSVKDGLPNLIMRAVVYWGLGYSGNSWHFVSLYLTALAAYFFLIVDLNKRLDHTVASNIILIGVLSFPWNGIFVYNFGYSSIPGNMLSLSAIITGFLMLERRNNALENDSKRLNLQ